MNKQAVEARRAYKRKWAKEHPDKVREYQRKYWTKKGEEAAALTTRSNKEQDGDVKNGE